MSGTFEIAPAVRKNTPVFIAIAGATGTGKTRSALELATGLAGPNGKILFADTEGSRALHYADLYKFDHVEWVPPFTPERNAELIELAENGKYAVLIIDSESDEMEGEGGLQEIAKSTGDEFWARTKARHKHALVNRMRRARIHIIFCMRCEERVRVEKVWDERKNKDVTAVIPIGWVPVCEKRFMHEVQSSFLLLPEAPGVPEPIRLYDIHERAFPKGQKISRESGRILAEWAAGGKPSSPSEPLLADRARDAAFGGKDALSAFWRGLSQAERHEIKDLVYGELAQIARRADEEREPLPDDPFGLAEQEHPGGGATTQEKGNSDLASVSPETGEQTARGAPAASGVREIVPAKVRGGFDWRGYAAQVLAAYRQVPPGERESFRHAQARYLALLRHADKQASTDMMMKMADIDREGPP